MQGEGEGAEEAIMSTTSEAGATMVTIDPTPNIVVPDEAVDESAPTSRPPSPKPNGGILCNEEDPLLPRCRPFCASPSVYDHHSGVLAEKRHCAHGALLDEYVVQAGLPNC